MNYSDEETVQLRGILALLLSELLLPRHWSVTDLETFLRAIEQNRLRLMFISSEGDHEQGDGLSQSAFIIKYP